MRLSQAKLESLIARSTDIVVGTSAAGKVIYYNDGATLSLGYSAEEILGESVVRLYPDLGEAKRVKQAMRDSGHGGRGIVETFQTTFLSKDGERIPVAISGTISYDEETGQEDGTIGFAKDLREILRKDQLAILGEVAVGLSHEINNPMSVILHQAELLERDIENLAGESDTSVECERLDAVRREVARVTAILGRLGEMVETEHYETVEYVGPLKMIDLRSEREKSPAIDQRLEGVRILVVDDDPGICSTLDELLSASGCKVETACNGAEGLEKVESSEFDVVLSDVVMPSMDGYELYQAIRERHPQLPVLMMTAFHYDKDHIIKRSRLKGLDGVIFKKPIDPVRLCEVLYETVTNARQAASE
ncbi:MAG: response regulator [Myxococcota bacterium]